MRMGSRGIWAVPVIASILILGTLGLSQNVFADTFQQLESNGQGTIHGNVLKENGIFVSSPFSILDGKHTTSVSFWLSRDPDTTGTVFVRVLDVDRNVKHTFGSVDVSTLPVGLSSSNPGLKVAFNDAPYTLQTDDRIMIQYPAGDSQHRVGARLFGSFPVFDGQNTQRIAHTQSGWVATALTDMKFELAFTVPPLESTLKIIKTATGGDSTFDFEVTGPTSSTPGITTVSGTGMAGPNVVSPGIYSVQESPIPTAWTLTNVICNDGSSIFSVDTVSGIVINAGDNIECTFENTFVPPTADLAITAMKIMPNGADKVQFDGIITGGTVDATAGPVSLRLLAGGSEFYPDTRWSNPIAAFDAGSPPAISSAEKSRTNIQSFTINGDTGDVHFVDAQANVVQADYSSVTIELTVNGVTTSKVVSLTQGGGGKWEL